MSLQPSIPRHDMAGTAYIKLVTKSGEEITIIVTPAAAHPAYCDLVPLDENGVALTEYSFDPKSQLTTS